VDDETGNSGKARLAIPLEKEEQPATRKRKLHARYGERNDSVFQGPKKIRGTKSDYLTIFHPSIPLQSEHREEAKKTGRLSKKKPSNNRGHNDQIHGEGENDQPVRKMERQAKRNRDQ